MLCLPQTRGKAPLLYTPQSPLKAPVNHPPVPSLAIPRLEQQRKGYHLYGRPQRISLKQRSCRACGGLTAKERLERQTCSVFLRGTLLGHSQPPPESTIALVGVIDHGCLSMASCVCGVPRPHRILRLTATLAPGGPPLVSPSCVARPGENDRVRSDYT